MIGICYIVGAGKFCGELCPDKQDLVIAADGGLSELNKRGIRCDLLIGDMDSLDKCEADVHRILFPVEKDETDTYLAYLEGVKRGYTTFVIYGGVGGRDDHTFANLSLLIGAINKGHRVTLVGEQFDIFAIKNEKIHLDGKVGKTVSAFAFGGEARGVSISGCKYPASDITLSPLFPLGVSNSIVADSAQIEVKDGTLLIMLQRM